MRVWVILFHINTASQNSCDIETAICGKNAQTIHSEFSAEIRCSFRKITPPGGSKTHCTTQRDLPEQLTTYIFNIKVPDGPVFQWYLRNCCHIDVIKVAGGKAPVLLTFDLKQSSMMNSHTEDPCRLQSGCCVGAAAHSSLLIAACQHDQSLHILLPDHSPEIFDSSRQRTLSCNELLPGVVTLPSKTKQT